MLNGARSKRLDFPIQRATIMRSSMLMAVVGLKAPRYVVAVTVACYSVDFYQFCRQLIVSPYYASFVERSNGLDYMALMRIQISMLY